MTLTATGSSVRLSRAFGTALVVTALWINVSEVFRYFVFVMPMMREAFPQVPGVAPMNFPVFLIWTVWDMILVLAVTLAAWVMLERFGTSLRVAFLVATALWASIFGILWIGLFNMNLATPRILAVALPLAWLELFVTVVIVWRVMSKSEPDRR